MSSSFLEKVYNYIKSNADGSSSCSSSSSSSGTSVSKSTSDTAKVLPFMTLTSNQVNTFEGIVTVTYTKNSTEYSSKVYVHVLTHGDFILNPIFCVTQVLSSSTLSTEIKLKFKRVVHATGGETLVGFEAIDYSDSSIVFQSLKIEGTTNSPTDYDALTANTEYKGSSIAGATYYSSFTYTTGEDITGTGYGTHYDYISIPLFATGLNTYEAES